MYYQNGIGEKYYFTPIKDNFSAAQICDVWNGAIERNARKWGETNGYEKVYVYDLYHNFVGEYDTLARNLPYNSGVK